MARLKNTTHDDATDWRLKPLVGLVVVLACPVIAWAGWAAVTGSVPLGDTITTAISLVCLVAVARVAVVSIRIRSTRHANHWTDAAVLVGLAVAPLPWVVLAAAAGLAATESAMGLARVKVAYNTGNVVLAAAGGGAVLAAMDSAGPIDQPLQALGPLAVARFVLWLIDTSLAVLILAFATRTAVGQRLGSDWDLKLFGLVSRFAVALLTLALLELNTWLLIAVPPIVLCLHLWHSARLRTRAERKAWQQLATATDALNVVDLDAVLRTATKSASELFSTDYVEVELWLDKERRLFRGDGENVLYDGPPTGAPHDPATAAVIPLEGYAGGPDIGALRLRFRGSVELSEREDYTLRTFASALCTAVRNAYAYAHLAQLAQQHEHDATHDPLTGLPNRRKLLDYGASLLDAHVSRGAIALMLIDLNHFKEINDTLGHSAGDRVLIEIAERLRAAAQSDTLVARLGGDEFAVLFSGLPAPALAAHRADEILAPVHEPIVLDGMRISVEASAGIAAAATGGMGEMLRRADIAMYQAKRSGQRIAQFTRSRDTADVGQLALGGDLARAVAEHEFAVNFQPIVNLATGEVIAAEALARWHHPDRGNLDPRSFLHAVERSGMLAAFAEAVLDQAVVTALNWADAGFDLPVAVNVSPRSLLDRAFPGMVLDRLQTRGYAPERLILELTETLTISQLEVVDQVLGELRAAGIRLALDDFGTGYSSLSVLSRIPVHELKIDQTFVRAMDSSNEAAAVVRSTVDLGHSLGLAVVAEGVESEHERRHLWELGCAAGQGHLFARPVPADRLLVALRRGCDGRPGTLAPPLHEEGAVIRLPAQRRADSLHRDERRAR